MSRIAALRVRVRAHGGGFEAAGGLWDAVGLGPRQAWALRGLCAQTDPEVFYPATGESNTVAKRICRVCPVRAECLEWALANGERFGIWGGLSERERRRHTGKPASNAGLPGGTEAVA